MNGKHSWYNDRVEQTAVGQLRAAAILRRYCDTCREHTLQRTTEDRRGYEHWTCQVCGVHREWKVR